MKDGMFYAPEAKIEKVVKDGEFVFSAIGLDHGHIYGMTNGLLGAGATLKYVYDPDEKKIEQFLEKYPNTIVAKSEAEIFADEEVKLIAAACIPNQRAELGIRVMKAGKDYFTDKTPLTSLEQLERVKEVCKETGKKYAVCYSERLQSECAEYAGELIHNGAIGKVIQVIGLGPHRLSANTRPDWFFDKEQYGGILCDIGSHQVEQFLYYTDAKDATVVHSKIGNYNNPEHIELDDFGDATLVADNGATCYFRVDWFTPDGLSTWGDGRTVILGTEGYIELRKYLDLAKDETGNKLLLANADGEKYIDVQSKYGFPFFGKFVLDCINRTENAMTQEHAFKAVELCVKAQMMAVDVTGRKIN